MGKKGRNSNVDRDDPLGKWKNHELQHQLNEYRSNSAVVSSKSNKNPRMPSNSFVPILRQYLLNEVIIPNKLAVNTAKQIKEKEFKWEKLVKSIQIDIKNITQNLLGIQLSVCTKAIAENDLAIKCADSIAKNLHILNANDVYNVLNRNHPGLASLFSVSSTIYGTMNNEYLRSLSHDHLDVLVLGSNVTSKGIDQLITANSSFYPNLSEVDDWEQAADISPCIPLRPPSNLRELYLIETSLDDLTTFGNLGNNYPQLKYLMIHHVAFDLEESNKLSCHVFEIISQRFKQLETLEISYCDWLNVSELSNWFFEHLNINYSFEKLLNVNLIGCRKNAQFAEMIDQCHDAEKDLMKIVHSFKDMYGVMVSIEE